MSSFFYICEFLEIEPQDFFDMQLKCPTETKILYQKLKSLNERQLKIILNLIDEFKT